jgi:hypothetical protein
MLVGKMAGRGSFAKSVLTWLADIADDAHERMLPPIQSYGLDKKTVKKPAALSAVDSPG